jgi:hypothetical protein
MPVYTTSSGRTSFGAPVAANCKPLDNISSESPSLAPAIEKMRNWRQTPPEGVAGVGAIEHHESRVVHNRAETTS